VICETNNGGDLVAVNLRNVCRDISCKSVNAARGKIIRAEPIAALYELGKVHRRQIPEIGRSVVRLQSGGCPACYAGRMGENMGPMGPIGPMGCGREPESK